MSLSANDNNSGFRVPSGKTPPPAPSAAFAKRAREMQSNAGAIPPEGAARYRPPALRALAAGEMPNEVSSPIDGSGAPLPPSNYGPGFRRARAGTLPSNVQLAAQRFAAASSTLGGDGGFGSTDSFVDQLQQIHPQQQQQQQRPHAASTASLTQPALRPSLRHATSVASSAASSALGERNSRLRSGSLSTLPKNNLSSAFGGSSVFSQSWMASNNIGVLDELRSVGSLDSGLDDFDVHTLDYLGLDDGHRTATLSELRAQTQAAITGNISIGSRNRASTVSNPYPRLTSRQGSLLPTPSSEEELYDDYSVAPYSRQRVDSHGNTLNAGGYFPTGDVARGFKQGDHLASGSANARPRAISVGILDNPAPALHRRPSQADKLSSAYMNEYNVQPQYAPQPSVGAPGGILKSDSKLQGGRAGAQSVHFPNAEPQGQDRQNPYLVAPNQQGGRAVSPKADGSSQMQTPTRSLWIGNLDSSVTSDQLIHVFAQYGAIESLRLLPEKECGFVNFVDMADAIRAKDDVLNRLGGHIGMPNGQTVRIGFGKADSAPVAPSKSTSASSPGPGSPAGPYGKPIGAQGMSGIESQLQSTPTRALWIGSIPSTTTPAAILSVFSPYGPIESARVLTHKNCGFINFERLDDAVRARKALNGRDILGSDVGAIRIGFAKVPVKNANEGGGEDAPAPVAQGAGDLSVGATIHALRSVKGASSIPTDQQVLSGAIENYRSNLLLSMIGSGQHTAAFVADGMTKQQARAPSVTEQQMIMKELSGGSPDAEADIQTLAEFRPPTLYYTTIPLVTERPNNRRWDASKLRELRKRMDSNTMTVEEVDGIARDFLDGEIVDLASDWLGNTVVQKLFEKCSPNPRFAMLERLSPHLAMIGIHKNGTWAAQKIIECVQTPEEVAMITQNLRPYGPPLLLDQFGNYVVQCCLRFGAPANEFIFDAMVDRLWEVAQGRFGARSMRACLESAQITLSQQRRVATAVILNSIPLATNPNGALLLTWLLDTSGFPSRYNLLAPRFAPHLSHLCTHKLASLTVLRIVNQKVEPDASIQIVDALFKSPGDHVLTDVLGDQVNGVAVVHKILTSPFLDPSSRSEYMEATKRVIIELKVIATQAYRRLIEEVGLPIPAFQPAYANNGPTPPQAKAKLTQQNSHGVPGLPSGYPSSDQGLASMMAALQMGGQNPHSGSQQQLHVDPAYRQPPQRTRSGGMPGPYSPAQEPFNPFALRSPDMSNPRGDPRAMVGNMPPPGFASPPPGFASPPPGFASPPPGMGYGHQSPALAQGGMMGMDPQQGYGLASPQQNMPPQLYQNYMYQMYQQNPAMGAYQS